MQPYNFIFGLVAQLGERSVRIREVEGSNPFRSTKQGSDEHLLFQRRFRRAVFALSHNKKRAVLGVIPRRRFFAIRTFAFCYFSCYNGCRKEQEVMQIHLFPYTVRPCAIGAYFLASVKFPYISIKGKLRKLRLIPHKFPLFFGILPKKRNKKSTNRLLVNLFLYVIIRP